MKPKLDISPAPRTPLDAAGTCTWAILLGNGQYVYSLEDKSTGFSLDNAHAWLSHDRAVKIAEMTPWIGASAKIVRARP